MGVDFDWSFVGYLGVVVKVGEICEEFVSYVNEVKFGVSWDWLYYYLGGEGMLWEFV